MSRLTSSLGAGAVGLLLAATMHPCHAGVITFDPADGYATGSGLGGQPAGGSPQWISGGQNLYTVASDGGTGGVAQSTANNPGQFVANTFTPDAAFLGGSDAASGLYDYSFSLRNDAESSPGADGGRAAHRIIIGGTVSAPAIRIDVLNNGRMRIQNAGSDSVLIANNNGNVIDLDGNSTNGVFVEVAGTINFSTQTFTLAFNGKSQSFNGSTDLTFDSSVTAGFGDVVFQQGGATESVIRQISIDDVSLNVVPEPGSMPLASLGLLALLRRTRR